MSDLSNAIRQICDEKGLSYEAVAQTIESALAAAYRKDFGEKNQNIKVEFDPETGKSKVFDVKTVVEDMPPEEPSFAEATEGKEVEKKEVKKLDDEKKISISLTQSKSKKENLKGEEEDLSSGALAEEEIRRFNPRTEVQISDAKLIKKTAKIGDEIITKLSIPDAYGRMAAQTAKQVIIQKLREAERDMIFNEFKDKEHEVISGVVQRREGRVILIDLGKAVGILPSDGQIYNEQYDPNQRIKIYVKEVNSTPKGPEIILSRTSEEILRKVFYLEIPEISNGLVEIKSVAREAGSRSKVAVASVSDNVDPIGSCVGQRGSRIQTIINELGGEKIDIIEYDEDIKKFIINALSPAKIISVELNSERSEEKKALVKVAEDQLSLAIGKDGQNVRLAARLTGWKIDIKGLAPGAPITPKDAKETPSDEEEDKKEKQEKAVEKKKDKKTEKKSKNKKEGNGEEKKEENKKDEKIKKSEKEKKDKKKEK
ncbi:MAG: transcription termination factor NusA [Patescibacteria group bacterium]|nr:transcription termination factor NusA [Patescibacteria group bacterium]